MRLLLFILLFSTVTLAVFSQSAQKLPANAKIIYFGDSQTSFGYNANGNSVQFQNYGFIAWTNALAPDVYMPKDGMLGVPGETTPQMVNRLNTLAPTGGKILVVLAGTNDPLYGIGPAATQANLRKIFDAGLAAGMKVVAITVQPRFGANAYNATNEANRKAINTWINSQTDVVVVDAENDLDEPQYFDDGLHHSPLGAFVLGSKVAAAVNKLVDHCLPGSLAVTDLATASNSNPLLAGTTGRTSSAAGTVASNWQLAGNFASTATVTGSKEADATGRDVQVINISGTYTGNTRKVTFNNYGAGAIALNTGEVAEGVAELEVAAPMTGIKSIYLNIQAYTADYSFTMAQGNSMWPTSPKQNYMPAGKYLLRTPPMTIGNGGTVGQLTTQVVIEFANTGTVDPISATLKFSSIGIRKLPLLQSVGTGLTPAGPLSLCPDSSVMLHAATGSGYTYEWNMNGTLVNDATTSSYAAQAPGTYTVKIGVPGCAVMSEAKLIGAATNCPAPNSVQTGQVSTALCSGQPLPVPFAKTGFYEAGNVFVAQLSDGNGSFVNAIDIGSVNDTAATSIMANLPKDISPGKGHRIRVVSSSPAITGSDNGQDITINAAVKPSISPADTVSSYPNLPATLSASPVGEGFSYKWLRGENIVSESGSSYTPTDGGDYRVVVTNTAGCTDTSKPAVVQLQNCTPLTITVSSSDASVFTVNASGGHAPYAYSLDSITYQAGNSFSNLNPGSDYTVYVKDAVNCTGQLTFTIKATKNCNDQEWIGGRSTTTTFASQQLGTTQGIVVVTYELLPVPEQIDIYYNDSTVVTSRNMADSLGWLWFQYSPPSAGPDKCNIRLQQTARDQTTWRYTALCPLNNYIPMGNSNDTTAYTVFVSPNFPNAYPSGSQMVHSFTPNSAGAKLQADFKALLLSESDTLFVYNGADTLAPLLGKYSGGYGYSEKPSVVATNPAGQLTFKFVSGSGEGKYGWIADVYYHTTIDRFYPLLARTGDTVMISGAGFNGTTAVRFGGTTAASFTVVSDTLIKAVVGEGLSGNVEVVAPNGTATKAGFRHHSEMPVCPNADFLLNAGPAGLSYQWQVSSDSVNFINLVDNEAYSGTNSSALQLKRLATTHAGYQYRCVVDGINGLTYTVRFVTTWTGGMNDQWENPANWSCGVVPDGNTDVLINNGHVVLNSNTAVRSLTMQQGVNLTLTANAGLTLQH